MQCGGMESAFPFEVPGRLTMKCATRCVFCNQPIEPDGEPAVLMRPQEEQASETYAHFRCYGEHELNRDREKDS